VLTPTRELAAQVHASTRECAQGLPLRSTTIFGGVSMNNQLKALRGGVDLLVATPGRLIDHLQRSSVDLGGIEILVLDEADRMLDMGFLPALRKIVAKLPKQRQTLLFSATFDGPIRELAQQFLHDPEQVSVTPPNAVTATVSHRIHPVDKERKRELLLHILLEQGGNQTLVFGRTKHGVDKLVQHIKKAGLAAAAIHGNKSQGQRTRALQDFKDHRIAVLVATDIAARGLDIVQLPLVINHDLPMVATDYVHRIGRTGRAGASGLAISLVCNEEAGLLRDIQKILKDPLETVPVEGFEPEQPLRMGSGKPQNGKARNRRNRPAGANQDRAKTSPKGPHKNTARRKQTHTQRSAPGKRAASGGAAKRGNSSHRQQRSRTGS
ncbi:MAG: DEAD/DEAH box helicase, partial [Sinobacteraceae bacterium]|nr:DEAD/DEAH box helicase [Nevskiaceae bacterium]